MKMIFKMGTDKTIFSRNRAEIARKEIKYNIEPLGDYDNCDMDIDSGKILIKLNNPYDVPVRADKLIAEILNVTRSKAKGLLSDEIIEVLEVKIPN